jgi:hypothetical protein
MALIARNGCRCDCYMRIVVGAHPDYEPLFSILDGLRVSIRHSFWMSEQSIEVNTCDIREDKGHSVTEVKIAFPMSHNILTSTEEDIQ